MSEATVRLSCQHYTYTTGDRVQPIAVGESRWCGECRAWRSIDVVSPPADTGEDT